MKNKDPMVNFRDGEVGELGVAEVDALECMMIQNDLDHLFEQQSWWGRISSSSNGKPHRLIVESFKPSVKIVHTRLMRAATAVDSGEHTQLQKGRGRITLPSFGRTEWAQVLLRFTDDNNIILSNGRDTKPSDFEGMGCKDRRTGRPNKAWKFLLNVARSNGVTPTISKTYRESVKKQKQEIVDILRKIFSNDTDPFERDGGGIYRAKFKAEYPTNDKFEL